jgi:tRNA/rRNA methyltransferase
MRIVLVETAGARNLGSVARVMKNFGLSELWLVNPQCDRFSDEAIQMAVHAPDILENAQIVHGLPEALVGCQRAIATAGRIDKGEVQVISPHQGLIWLSQVMRIPVNPDYPSLNLSQAVGICCYQWQILQDNSISHENLTSQTAQDLLKSAPIDLATREELEAYYQQLESVLLKIGYVYPHTAFARLQKFRHIFDRANLSSSEVTMLRGILRQVNWATDQ